MRRLSISKHGLIVSDVVSAVGALIAPATAFRLRHRIVASCEVSPQVPEIPTVMQGEAAAAARWAFPMLQRVSS